MLDFEIDEIMIFHINEIVEIIWFVSNEKISKIEFANNEKFEQYTWRSSMTNSNSTSTKTSNCWSLYVDKYWLIKKK